MLDEINDINQLIEDGYRVPHDIEVVACKIYYSKYYNELIEKKIVKNFVSSVSLSKYSDMGNITYEYMSRLVNSDNNLLYEEFLKIIHLFDSINIFFYLGLDISSDLIEKSDKNMVFLLKKHRKWSSNIILEDSKNKLWWQRIFYQKEI